MQLRNSGLNPDLSLKFMLKLWDSMFEPGVLELYVRTLGSGTLCSNLGFGELHVRTPSSGTPPPPSDPRVRTLGSGTPCSNSGFGNSMLESRVLVLPLQGVRTLGSMFETEVGELLVNPKVWNSSPLPPQGVQTLVRKLHVPSNFKKRRHAPASFGEGGLRRDAVFRRKRLLWPVPATKAEEVTRYRFMGRFCEEIKEREERKIVNEEFFFSRGFDKELEVPVEISKAANK